MKTEAVKAHTVLEKNIPHVIDAFDCDQWFYGMPSDIRMVAEAQPKLAVETLGAIRTALINMYRHRAHSALYLNTLRGSEDFKINITPPGLYDGLLNITLVLNCELTVCLTLAGATALYAMLKELSNRSDGQLSDCFDSALQIIEIESGPGGVTPLTITPALSLEKMPAGRILLLFETPSARVLVQLSLLDATRLAEKLEPTLAEFRNFLGLPQE